MPTLPFSVPYPRTYRKTGAFWPGQQQILIGIGKPHEAVSSKGNLTIVPPPARQVMPNLFTPLAAMSSVAKNLKFALSIKRAKSVSIFSQIFQHVFFRRRLAFDRIFKGLMLIPAFLHQSKSGSITKNCFQCRPKNCKTIQTSHKLPLYMKIVKKQ